MTKNNRMSEWALLISRSAVTGKASCNTTLSLNLI